MNKISSIELSFEIGKSLLENGAEISRVQETMERVAKAYDVDSFNAYVLTNAIFVNGIESGEVKNTALKHIKSTRVHIGRISALNQLSREITAGDISIEAGYERLRKINEIPYSRLILTMLACAAGSMAFALLTGGSFLDSSAAFVCGFLVEGILHLLEKHKTSKFLVNLLASAFVSVLASLFVLIGFGDDSAKIIIGSIIRLVPGMALTNSIRDFFNGDYLSGSIRMIDALIVGVCIGVGVGTVIRLFSMITGGAL